MANPDEPAPTDHYRVLGVDPAASAADIAAAYRAGVRRHHPDLAPHADAEEFRRLQNAYEVLSNPNQRSTYDRARRTPPGARPPGPRRGVRIPVHHANPTAQSNTARGGHPGDRHVDAAMSFPVAVLGGTVTVTHGDTLRLRVPPGTPANTILRAVGRGASVNGTRGDLFITLHIDVPKHPTDEQRQILEAFGATLDAHTDHSAQEERNP